MLSLRGGGWATHKNLIVTYISRVVQKKMRKCQNPHPMPDPPPSSGLTLIGALLSVNYEMC